jgi:hypothetical protein
MTTYRGRCHCGAVRFELQSEPITTGVRCNCSLCSRRGALMSTLYFPADKIVIEGREALAVYHWGDRMVNHYFCRTCGIYPFHDGVGSEGAYRVNLACLEPFDAQAIAVTTIDGKSY